MFGSELGGIRNFGLVGRDLMCEFELGNWYAPENRAELVLHVGGRHNREACMSHDALQPYLYSTRIQGL